jgi:hypothetical protein
MLPLPDSVACHTQQLPANFIEGRPALLRFALHGGNAMPTSDLLPSLLSKLNENQLALEAAILELSNWVELRGAVEVADNVRGALVAINRNEEFIKMTLAVMMTPE